MLRRTLARYASSCLLNMTGFMDLFVLNAACSTRLRLTRSGSGAGPSPCARASFCRKSFRRLRFGMAGGTRFQSFSLVISIFLKRIFVPPLRGLSHSELYPPFRLRVRSPQGGLTSGRALRRWGCLRKKHLSSPICSSLVETKNSEISCQNN